MDPPVTTAIRADAENIGFAIPVDSLREVLPEMLSVERRYGFLLGATVSNVEEAMITETHPGSPAADADVRVGDIVRGIDGTTVVNGIDFHVALIGRRPGESILLRLQRADADPLLPQRRRSTSTPPRSTPTPTEMSTRRSPPRD